jgi:hypothetical protein
MNSKQIETIIDELYSLQKDYDIANRLVTSYQKKVEMLKIDFKSKGITSYDYTDTDGYLKNFFFTIKNVNRLNYSEIPYDIKELYTKPSETWYKNLAPKKKA